MNAQVHVQSYGLHVAASGGDAVQVDPSSPLAGALVVAVRRPDTPALVMIADTEALGRQIEGCAAVSCMESIVAWCFQHLPSEWVSEGPMWVVMSGESFIFSLSVGPGYRLTWTPMRWPGCLPGSMDCFTQSQPTYAQVVLRMLDDIAWV